jgi:hypothetical protein
MLWIKMGIDPSMFFFELLYVKGLDYLFMKRILSFLSSEAVIPVSSFFSAVNFWFLSVWLALQYDNYHGNDGAPLAMLTSMFFGPIIASIFAVLTYQIFWFLYKNEEYTILRLGVLLHMVLTIGIFYLVFFTQET